MSMAERKTMTRAVKNPVKRKLTRAEKKEIAAVIQAAKGDGKPHTAQQTIPYLQMYPDGICRVTEKKYSKSLVFEDINYQLAQADDKTAIFENWCDFLNYFDASVSVQLSFINQGARKEKAQAAISNLVKNALDHTEKGGLIRIEWRAFTSIVQISVKDNGSGIHPDDLYHIFKRFYRSRFSKDTQGIGLGLSLTKAIVEAHNGTIEVDSTVGMGTSFTINFLNPTKL